MNGLSQMDGWTDSRLVLQVNRLGRFRQGNIYPLICANLHEYVDGVGHAECVIYD